MQPHSMCAVAIGNYIWNSSTLVDVVGARMKVEYFTHENKFKILYYQISHVKISEDRRTFSMQIVRDGGGINCIIESYRPSLIEGTKVTMQHQPSHLAGLREEYYLYKKQIQGGRHINSERYRNFSGYAHFSDRLSLLCELYRLDRSLFIARYDLQILSITDNNKKSNS